MKSLPKELEGKTIKVNTGCGGLYVTINFVDKKIVQVFALLGKSGGCPSSMLNSIAGLINLCLRNDIQLDEICKILSGQRCHNIIYDGEKQILSCTDAMYQTLSHFLPKKEVDKINGVIKEQFESEKK